QAAHPGQPAGGPGANSTHEEQLKGVQREHLTAALANLERKKGDLEARQSALLKTQKSENYDRVFKGRVIIGTTRDQLKTVDADLNAVRQQINYTGVALSKLK